MANIPDSPITRKEKYLDAIANGTTEVPEPITREEEYLAWIALNGGGGGGGTGEVTGVKGSAESTFRKGNVSISPANIGLDKVNNTPDLNKPISNATQAALDLKVDKVEGKVLSDNNYSDDDKAIVDGVETELAKKVNKVTGKGLSTNDYTNDDKAIVDGVTAALADKVDKVQGKGLSTNDYTDTDKAEVAKVADKADADDVIDGATYDSENHLILFKNGSTTLFSLDAAAFVKDGMVDTVEITGGNLVITFNTDAGKQAISIPLTDIFDPSNYYNKTATDNLLADKADKTSVIQFKTTTETDANNLWEESGYYIVNTSDMTNLPTTDVSMGYCLEVIRYGSFSNSLVVQIAYRGNPTTENPIYMRRRFNDVWTDWVAIAKKSDVIGKADKVSGATNGNFAGLDASGNLTDSGKKAADFQPVIPEAFTGDLNTLSARGFHQYTAAYADLSNAPTVSYTVNRCYIDVWSDGAGNVCQIIKLVGLTYDPAAKYCDIFKRSCYSTGSALSWGAWEKQNGKTDLITSPTNNNLVAMDANGNIKDSGKNASDFETDNVIYDTTIIDCDNAFIKGKVKVYNLSGASVANLPATDKTWYVISVCNTAQVSQNNYVTQIATDGGNYSSKDTYIRHAYLNNGSIAWTTWEKLTSKADKVASAISGNLASLDTNGNLADSGVSAGGVLTAKGALNESTDLNTIVAPGVYGFGSQNYIVNGPTGATYGVLTVFCTRNVSVSYNYIVQAYKNRGNSKSWHRLSTNGGTEWTDWFYSSTASEGTADILTAGTDTEQRSWSAKMLKDEFGGSGYLPLTNLGTEYTAELKADISSGKFEKAVVGGYLTINGHVYYLAHPDYWLHTGDTECTTHHMLIVPAGNIGTGKMNDSNITTGGYAGSGMKTGANSNTALATAAAQIKADFGASNILTHRELFANAVTDGKASGWAWADSDVDLMNEVMVYGCNVWGSHPGYETGVDKCQLKLFQERPDLITTRALWWLRSVVSATNFADVGRYGNADYSDASGAYGVRPAFAIC